MSDEPEDLPDDSSTSQDTPADDAASKRAYTRKVNAAEVEMAEAKMFWDQALDHPIGRRELWKVLNEAKAFESNWACGPNGFPNPDATLYHRGVKDYGFQLFLSWFAMCPEKTMLMVKEHHVQLQPAPTPRKGRADT